MIEVSIIIINYNTFRLTSDCIRSVIRETKNRSYEIILVDNASTEKDADQFLNEFPNIVLVKSPVNGGFAYGNNIGIQKASGKYILLLNSDTLFTEDSVTNCIGFLQNKNDLGVLGCRMTFPDGAVQYTARRFRSISWELLDLFRFIPYMMPYKNRSRRMLGKYFRHDENLDCDWLNGAFFLFPRTILDLMPGKKLDDRFFMYGEDQLWCEQVSKAGLKSFFYSETSIIHINSGSTDPSRQLALRKLMRKHEFEIMKARKGTGLYYQLFKIIFVTKEATRNFIKMIWYKLSGRLLR